MDNTKAAPNPYPNEARIDDDGMMTVSRPDFLVLLALAEDLAGPTVSGGAFDIVAAAKANLDALRAKAA